MGKPATQGDSDHKGGEELPAADVGDGQGAGKARRRFVMGTVFDIGQTNPDDGTPPAVSRGTKETASV